MRRSASRSVSPAKPALHPATSGSSLAWPAAVLTIAALSALTWLLVVEVARHLL